MPAQSCEGAVDLFGQHGSGKFMRKSHRREGQKKVGARLPKGWQAIVAADQKDHIPAQSFAFGKELNEAGGIPGFARRVEKHLVRRRMAGEYVVAIRVNLAHGNTGPAASSLEEFFGDGIGMFVPGFADVEQI